MLFLFAPISEKEYISKATASFVDSWIVQELDNFLVNIVDLVIKSIVGATSGRPLSMSFFQKSRAKIGQRKRPYSQSQF